MVPSPSNLNHAIKPSCPRPNWATTFGSGGREATERAQINVLGLKGRHSTSRENQTKSGSLIFRFIALVTIAAILPGCGILAAPVALHNVRTENTLLHVFGTITDEQNHRLSDVNVRI